jgi:hypothetical protein
MLLSKSTNFLRLDNKFRSNYSLISSGFNRNLYLSSKKILGLWYMLSILWVHTLGKLWRLTVVDLGILIRLHASNVLQFLEDGVLLLTLLTERHIKWWRKVNCSCKFQFSPWTLSTQKIMILTLILKCSNIIWRMLNYSKYSWYCKVEKSLRFQRV